MLATYAKMPNDKEKLNRARALISCLLHYDTLSQEIMVLPEQLLELETTYTDAVWNPFTATIMDESVKRRITNAYNNVLLPYLFEKVKADLDCSNVEGLQQLFQRSHKRLLELRGEDTSKLERRLRKERNPKVVLQLLNLTPLEE